MPSTGRLGTYIDKDLHTELKVYAAKTGQSIASIVEAAIREYLARQEKKNSTK